MKEWKL